jgi:hypothetical protein
MSINKGMVSGGSSILLLLLIKILTTGKINPILIISKKAPITTKNKIFIVFFL